MRYKYTEDDKVFLQKYYPLGDWDIIMERFPNQTKSSIYSFCYKHNIKNNCKDTSFNAKNFKSPKWTKDEEEILKKNYSILPMDEISKLLPNRSYNAITLHANKLNIPSFGKAQSTYSVEEIAYIKDNWLAESDYQLSLTLHRTFRSIKAKREELGLYRQLSDNFTYENLNKFLRGNTWQWKTDSKRACGNRCILTGSPNFDIHHIYNFQKILNEFIEKYKIPVYEDINLYSDNELLDIVNLFQKYHASYPLGVCIRKDLHKLFHRLYGKNNNQVQWNDFVRLYMKGDLDKYLST